MLTIYHNPRCSKSRETLQIIKDHKQEVKVVEYLKDIPTREGLSVIVEKLGIHPSDLVRKGEALYKEKYKDKDVSEEEWLTILAENPRLIERPIVVKGDQAVLGRPPENVKELF